MTDETTISYQRNLVTIRNLKKIYRTEDGEKVALHDVNLNITKRDIYGIIGLSGAGKSTLVRCINGLERYDGGSMVVDGHEITRSVQKRPQGGMPLHRHDFPIIQSHAFQNGGG